MDVDPPPPAIVEVHHARPRPAEPLTAVLDAGERQRLAALRTAEGRDPFATAHALLRAAVAERVGVPAGALVLGATCVHCGGPHGRPELHHPAGTGLHLGLSHAATGVAVAITAAGRVGVDVETAAAADFDGFDEIALTGAERAAVSALAPEWRAAGRAVLWSRKEALLKATGEGLLTDPRRVEVSAPFAAARLVAWLDDDGAPGPGEPGRGAGGDDRPDDRPDGGGSGGGGPGAAQLVDLTLPAGLRGAVAVLGPGRPTVVVRSGEALLDALVHPGWRPTG